MSVNTANIFSSLLDDSDNEAPVKKTQPAAKVAETKPATTTGSAVVAGGQPARGAGRGERRTNTDGGEGESRQTKEHYKPRDSRDKNQKPKGVSSQPHPQDRQSGTGVPAYEKKFRKEGGGRHNYGTVKDEVKDLNTEQSVAKVEEAPVVPEEPVVVDNTITVEEYFRNLGVDTKQVAVKEALRELNHEELKRDKLQLVVSRTEKVIDANVVKAPKKKGSNNPTYLLGCNTENSQLLGVQTGQVTVKFTEKPAEGASERVPRENNNREPREPRANKPAHNNNHGKQLKKVQVESETDFPKLG